MILHFTKKAALPYKGGGKGEINMKFFMILFVIQFSGSVFAQDFLEFKPPVEKKAMDEQQYHWEGYDYPATSHPKHKAEMSPRVGYYRVNRDSQVQVRRLVIAPKSPSSFEDPIKPEFDWTEERRQAFPKIIDIEAFEIIMDEETDPFEAVWLKY